jgi:hypothetical protein
MMNKNYFWIGLILFSATSLFAQEPLPSVGKFGNTIDGKGAMEAKKLPKKMKSSESLEVKVKGEIVDVCQAKGCWMTIDMGNNETMRVKFKDYGFFVPKDAAGKIAILQGVALREMVSVEDLKHLAEDAGKSEAEIDAITHPKEELTFVAEGVIIQ